MGPSRNDGCSITRERAVILPILDLPAVVIEKILTHLNEKVRPIAAPLYNQRRGGYAPHHNVGAKLATQSCCPVCFVISDDIQQTRRLLGKPGIAERADYTLQCFAVLVRLRFDIGGY